MPRTQLTDAEKATIRRLRAEGQTLEEIMRATGRSSGAVRAYWAQPELQAAGKGRTVVEKGRPVEEPRAEYAVEYDPVAAGFAEKADGTATATAETGYPVRTLDEAVRAAGVDTRLWAPAKWSTTTKSKGGSTTHKVQLDLKRVLPRHVNAAFDAVYARMADHAPRYAPPPLPRYPRDAESYLAVAALFDAHFGKLAWAPETDNDYDLRIAERVYANAVEDTIAEAAGRPVGEWLLVAGQDMIHLDNARNTTFNGTPQDVDGRYAKVIETAEMAAIRAIERLMTVAPVRVVHVPGNHDTTVSYHLTRTVAAWFRNCTRVTVDYSPSPRKYVRWGSTLIGLTHGNEEKFESLPAIMATERPHDWAASTCREFLLGHMHRSRAWQTKPVDTHEGTTIRALRSLAATDAWHHKKGYISGPSGRAAEVYFYGKTSGFKAQVVVPVRDE